MNLSLRDEVIMAFADGELDAQLAEKVRRAIEADANVRTRHEVYSGTRRVLAHAFDDVLDDPLPARLTRPFLAAKAASR